MKMFKKFFSYLLVALLPVYVIAQQNTATPVTLKKIGDNIYEVKGGRGANGGAFIGKSGVLLIDAKMDKESVDQTLTEIRKLTDKPIRFMVNTHSDGDHVAGNKFFSESVIFVAHENCRKEFFHPGRNGEPSSWSDPSLAPYIPSVTFNDKMDLYIDDKKVELWYFGKGHTTGDLVVYFPDDRIAFMGDQIFMERPQLIHSYKGGNSFEHVKTLEKMLATLDAEIFCSGHSDALGRDMVQAHINKTKDLQSKVDGFVKKNYSLENLKKEFTEEQAGLVETVYNELTAAR